MRINENELVNLYNKGYTDKQLAQTFSISGRQVRNYLSKLRSSGTLDYRKYATPSKVLVNPIPRVQESPLLQEAELLKLFSIYRTRSKVAKALKVSPKTVSTLCEKYQIVDTDYLSKQVIASLHSLLGKVVPYKVIKTPHGAGDTLVIHLTDFHAGKIVKDSGGNIVYNEGIFKLRMDKFCAQLLRLLDTNIKKGVPITDVVILSTGDNANGENIYATQAYEQELAPPKQVMLVVEVMSKLIKAFLDRKLKVTLHGVKGNHGRTGKDTDPTANWDLMIYMVLDFWAKQILKNKNFTVNYTEADYLVISIRDHKYLIRHIAPEQPDTPSGRVKFNEWARQHDVDAIVYGHYHHFGVFDVDGIRVFRGGSVVGHDNFAEAMAKQSEPIQLVWGVNDKRVSSFLYSVDLKGK